MLISNKMLHTAKKSFLNTKMSSLPVFATNTRSDARQIENAGFDLIKSYRSVARIRVGENFKEFILYQIQDSLENIRPSTSKNSQFPIWQQKTTFI